MLHLWCLLSLLFLIVPAHPLPTLNYDRQLQSYFVDIHQFSQLLSSHLIFDHLDGTLSVLSKQISQHFQNLVQVTVHPLGLSDDFEVDIDLLKGQLQGAVGSYIEDSLPSVWNTRCSIIDKSSLATYIEETASRFCTVSPDNTLTNTCIQYHANDIVAHVDQYIHGHLKAILRSVVIDDLPPLFQTTQSHVHGILAHFSHYLVRNNSPHHRHTNEVQNSSNKIVIQQDFENSVELIKHLESTLVANTLHASLQKFITLSRVD